MLIQFACKVLGRASCTSPRRLPQTELPTHGPQSTIKLGASPLPSSSRFIPTVTLCTWRPVPSIVNISDSLTLDPRALDGALVQGLYRDLQTAKDNFEAQKQDVNHKKAKRDTRTRDFTVHLTI
jgi:hypothetical protein